MADLNEFIKIYKDDLQQSTAWLQAHTVDSFSWDSLEQLSIEYAQKITWESRKYLLEIKKPISILFQKSAHYLSLQIIKTAEDFIELTNKFPSNLELFLNAKPDVIYLFKTAKQFNELVGLSSDVGKKMIELKPEYISSLFHTAEEFIDLEKKSYSTAEDLLKSKSQHIASLFQTDAQLLELKNESSFLYEKIIKIKTSPPISSTKDQSFIRHESPPNKVECLSTKPEAVSYTSTSTFFKPSEQDLPQANSNFYSRVVSPKPNSSLNLKLKLFAGLGILCGVAMMTAGFMIGQPEVIAIGLFMTIMSAILLTMLFVANNKIDPIEKPDNGPNTYSVSL
jgi:hypothetical protein